MNRIRRIAVFGLGILIFAAAAFSQSKGKNPLAGVWKVTEVTTTGPNATNIKNPQPGLYIFTGKHYSIMTVNADKPRPELPQDQTKATADQLRDVWGPFTANSGTYESKANELTTHPMVAKTPAVMASGSAQTFTFKVEANTLTLTQKTGQRGPVPNPSTWKLTKVE